MVQERAGTMTAGTLRRTQVVSSATAPTQKTRRGTWTRDLVRTLPREWPPSVPSHCVGMTASQMSSVTSLPSPHWPAEGLRSWGEAPRQNSSHGTIPCGMWSAVTGATPPSVRPLPSGLTTRFARSPLWRGQWAAGAQSGRGRPYPGRGGPWGLTGNEHAMAQACDRHSAAWQLC